MTLTRILVVGDELVAAAGLQETLARLDYEPLTPTSATVGPSGWSEGAPPDLIIHNLLSPPPAVELLEPATRERIGIPVLQLVAGDGEVPVLERQACGLSRLRVPFREHDLVRAIERVVGEADCRRRDAHLRLAVEAAEAVTWALDVASGGISYSSNFAEMKAVSDVTPYRSLATFLEQLHPEDRESVDQAVRRTIETIAPLDLECRVRMVEGHWGWLAVRGKPLTGPDGRVTGVIGVSHDITERKQHAAELARARDFYLHLLEHAPALVWRASTDAQCDWFNVTWLEFTGRRLGQELGDGWVEGVHPGDLERCVAYYLDHFRRREAFRMEYRLRRHDGVYRWIVDFGAPFQNLAGEFAGYIGYCYDITDHKEVESELRENRQRLQLALDAARMGVWEFDFATERLSWSPEIFQHLGVPLMEPTRERMLAMMHPDDVGVSQAAMDRALAGHTQYHCEYRVIVDGRTIWVEDSGLVLRDAAGRPARVVGTALNITARKSAEAALRASEQRFRTYVEQAADALFVSDAEGRLLDVNPCACERLGYTREELLQRTVADVDADFTAEEVRHILEKLGPGQQLTLRGQHRRKDGTTMPVELRAGAFEQDGRRLYLTLAREIADRELAEQQARELRNLALAAAAATDLIEAMRLCLASALRVSGLEAGGIYLLDEAAGTLELVCHTGLSPQFIAAVRCYPVDSPNFRWAKLGLRAFGTPDMLGLPDDSEVRREGLRVLSLHPILVGDRLVAVFNLASREVESVCPSAQHAVETIASLVADLVRRFESQESLRRMNQELEQRVTERTRALAQSEQRFRAIFQSSRDAILITDLQGRVLDCNPAAVTMFGYPSREALLDVVVQDLSPERQADGRPTGLVMAEMNPRLIADRGADFQWTHRRRDGTPFPAEVSIAIAEQEQGGLLLHAVVRDITSRKAAEEALHAAKAAADAANRAKSAFLATMSHEIRTPMNAILGFSQLLLRDPQATPLQRQQLETVNRSGEHLLALLNDVLEMARIESGRLALKPVAFDLPALLDEVEHLFELRARGKQLDFAVRRPPGLPRRVVADQTRLRQILLNLLSNAIKFTPPQGQVLMCVGSEGAAASWQLWVEIQDTGPGIAPADLQKLFRPFFQTDSGRHHGGGTGLGLAISREFARLMGGQLTVRSALGQGSTFRLELPLVAGVEPGSEDALPDRRQVRRLMPGQLPCRVLVVDDEPDNRDLLVHTLVPLGFEVASVASGPAALAHCEAAPPSLVLLDLRMPEMDGCDVARRLRACHGTGIKIIVLSATVFPEDQERAFAAGADSFLGKPFQEWALLDEIQRFTGVEYVQAERPPDRRPDPRTTAGDPGSRRTIHSLPEALVVELRAATARADYGELLRLAERVVAIDAGLGRRFREWIEQFEYDALLAELATDPSDN